ncbi:probable acyl-activating enzyme 17, peroxisomal [Zingiber officinale]|uniref:probable acyl-activating enzyme 17, peroxisomal n=1 Tax=Zingiber officinale TaxID=94328 RepID=UPI001C4D70AB|nr:probable acyl-activating enzyme 17, peroxisomal [Zingiber officinale]
MEVADVTAEEIEATGVPPVVAQRLHAALRRILSERGTSGPEAWDAISKQLLSPRLPFPLHQMLYYGCYRGFRPDPPPAWLPDKENAAATNIGRVLQKRGKELLGDKYKDPASSFPDLQAFSVANPEAYWKMVFEEMDISFPVPPSCILRCTNLYPGGQWLPGAYLNSASLCLSLNGNRNLDDVAIIWRDEGYDALPVNTMTFKELRTKVWLVSNALDTLGLPKGSAVAIDMPMTVTSIVIYLAIVLAGYVVVSIADSFVPKEIVTRLNIANAKAIFTQDYILRGEKKLPLYSKVVEAHAPLAIVVSARVSTTITGLRADDISWHNFLERVKHTKDIPYEPVDKPIEAFMNVLFSSGTTGEPKAIPWTHATPLKAASDAWSILDIRKGDVVAWPTNLGWMMGPWLVYASLINGASMALYHGIPLGSGFTKFVQDAKVTMLGVVPSIVRAWKDKNCTTGLDWSSIRCFSSTGEASSVDDYLWLMGRAHYKPVIECCGGTEIGSAFVSGTLLQPQALAAFSTSAPGCKIYILDGDGNPLPDNVAGIGEVALDPTMFGASTTLLNADHYDVYFKGMPIYNGKQLRRHGDIFMHTPGGYYRPYGRADDVMNLGGIKVSSVEIEQVCNSVNDTILETAAIGVPPSSGGPEQLFMAVVFKDQYQLEEEDLDKLKLAFNSALQKKLNPLFKVSFIVPMASLPRTASNKVMRRILREQLSQQSKI